MSIMLTAEQQRRQDKVSICVLSGAPGGGQEERLGRVDWMNIGGGGLPAHIKMSLGYVDKS